MRIRIFQINPERDKERLRFAGLDELKKLHGNAAIDPSIYGEVFRGDLDCADPEEIFDIFNTSFSNSRFKTVGHPLFRGRSMSVSDIVLIEGCAPLLEGVIRFYSPSGSCTTASYNDPDLFAADLENALADNLEIQVNDYRGKEIPVIENGAYFCDSVGFPKVDFDPSLAHRPDDLLQIVYVEPGRPPFVSDVGSDLRSMQKAVDGLIEPIYNRDGTLLIANEESKLIGMDGNRRVDGSIIAGPFFVVGDSGESFRSLTDTETHRYMERFAQPEDISQEEVQEDSGFTFMAWR